MTEVEEGTSLLEGVSTKEQAVVEVGSSEMDSSLLLDKISGRMQPEGKVLTGVEEGTSLLEEVSTEKHTVVVSSEMDSFMGLDGSSGEIQPEGKELSNVKGSDVFLDSASVQPPDGSVAGSVPTEVQQEVEIHSDHITSETTIVPLRFEDAEEMEVNVDEFDSPSLPSAVTDVFAEEDPLFQIHLHPEPSSLLASPVMSTFHTPPRKAKKHKKAKRKENTPPLRDINNNKRKSEVFTDGPTETKRLRSSPKDLAEDMCSAIQQNHIRLWPLRSMNFRGRWCNHITPINTWM